MDLLVSGDIGVILAMVLFILSILICLYILIPQKHWGFHVSVETIMLDIATERQGDEGAIVMQTAVALDLLYKENVKKLDQLNVLLFFAIFAIVGQAIAWIFL